jgi:hypothetical protein
MRIRLSAAILVAALSLTSVAWAQEPRASVQAFGGLGLGSATTTNANFGGAIAGRLTPNIQLVGEAGRIGNVLPSTTQTLVGLTGVGFGVSAWYGDAGVRVTGGSSSVRPYAELAGGIARMQPHVNGLEGVPGVIANAGLSLLNRTAPMASMGGGVTFEAGSLVADIGYRHRRIFSDSWMQALALGGSMSSNEVRVGFGVRF